MIEVPVQSLLLPPPVFAGMNPLVVNSIALQALRSHDHIKPPIIVDEVFPGIWRIVGGRHRFFGSVIAGRQTMCAEERHTLS